MEIFLGFFIAIAAILVVLCLRSFTTFFHEMGHALPALLFSTGPVYVYIGTYGDITNCTHFSFGRLEIFFRLNLLDWKMGMCEHSPPKELWKSALFFLGGPIASLVVALPLIWVLTNYPLSQVSTLIISTFVLAATLDFLVNMTPWNTPIYMHNGHVSFCDGHMLLSLFLRLFSPKEYKELEGLFVEKKFREVQNQAEKLIEEGKHYRDIYDLAIAASMALKKGEEALWFYEKLNEKHKLKSYDFMNIAKLYLEQKRDDDALECLNQCIYLQHDFAEALIERGQIKTRKKDYEAALKDFNMAIRHAPENAHFYMHRGFAKIKMEDYPGALLDLNFAKDLGEDSAYLLDCFGDYYEAVGDWEKATQFYKEARR